MCVFGVRRGSGGSACMEDICDCLVEVVGWKGWDEGIGVFRVVES